MGFESLISLNFNYWVLQTLAMLLTALLIPGLKVTSPLGAFGAVVALALVNAKLWDAALFFHIPDQLTTQVLLLLLANGAIFWIIVKLLPGIEVKGVIPALVAPVVFTVSSVIISTYLQDVDWAKVWNHVQSFVITIRQYFIESGPPSGSGPA